MTETLVRERSAMHKEEIRPTVAYFMQSTPAIASEAGRNLFHRQLSQLPYLLKPATLFSPILLGAKPLAH